MYLVFIMIVILLAMNVMIHVYAKTCVREQFLLECEWKINTILKAFKSIVKQQPKVQMWNFILPNHNTFSSYSVDFKHL
jgi:hypothetical protein